MELVYFRNVQILTKGLSQIFGGPVSIFCHFTCIRTIVLMKHNDKEAIKMSLAMRTTMTIYKEIVLLVPDSLIYCSPLDRVHILN